MIDINEIKKIASHADDRIQLWSDVLTATNVKTMAEIGVWKGDFAKQVLEGCKEIEKYYMVDP